ncbi:hypothetical protein IFR05_000512 [Cadophora sp. M221]|nr:hypothetical protein IFR05_000512 [Cadophora sp. M221]
MPNDSEAQCLPTAEAHPVYDVARECDRLFKQCPQWLKGQLEDTISTSQRRFGSWAAYLGVFALKSASLDTRLRFEPEIRDLTMLLLDVLQTDLRRGKTLQRRKKRKVNQLLITRVSVTKLASKRSLSRRNTLGKSNIVTASSSPAEDVPLPLSKETIGALYGIVGSIDRLHRLAVRIRTSSKDNQTLEERVTNFAKQLLPDGFKNAVYHILKYKFPKAEEELIMKLTKSIVFRRHRLMYQRHHYKKLSYDRQPSSAEVTQLPDSKPITTKSEGQQQQSRSKTSLLKEKKDKDKYFDHPGDDQKTERVSSTNPTLFRKDCFDQQGDDKGERPAPTVFSVGSSWVGKIEYPMAPKSEGTSTHAVCQFCFQELQVVGNEDPKWWERHVDRDMDHYICLSDECRQSLHYFYSFHSWIEHMESEHEPDWPRFIYPKSSEWRCTLSGDHTGSFTDVVSLEQHLSSFHSKEFDMSDLDLVAKNSRFPQPRDPDICPLCQESINSLKPAVQHQEPEKKNPSRKKRVVKFKDQSSSSGDEIDGKIQTASSLIPPRNSTSKMVKHVAKHLKSVSFLSLRGLEPEEEDEEDDSSGAKMRGSDRSTFNGSIAFEYVSQDSAEALTFDPPVPDEEVPDQYLEFLGNRLGNWCGILPAEQEHKRLDINDVVHDKILSSLHNASVWHSHPQQPRDFSTAGYHFYLIIKVRNIWIRPGLQGRIKRSKRLESYSGHSGAVWSVVFSPDGNKLASGSDDYTIRVWDITTGQVQYTLKGHLGVVLSVVFSPNKSKLASGSNDCTVRVWDIATGQAKYALEGHLGGVTSVVFSPDGSKLASGSNDCTIRVWDVTTGQAKHTLKGHSSWVRTVVFSPDGSRLASGSDDRTVRVWDVLTGQAEHTLEGHSDKVWSVVFSPDGSKLGSGSDDCTVQVWDVATGQAEYMLEGHLDGVNNVVFSPDGSKLASASDDRTVRVWDIATGQAEHTLEGHSGWVRTVVFSPNGSKLASGSGDRTVRVWDVATGQAEYTLEGYSGVVLSVVFSPDGSKLASGLSDGTLRVWDV